MTFAYEQTALFITLECEQQSVPFPALLIGNHNVIEKLEQSRPENLDCHFIVGLLTDIFFRGYSCVYWIIPLQPHVNFLDFSAAELLRYNELLNRIKTEITNSAKRNVSLSANSMVYHMRVCASVCNIPCLSH